MNEVESCIEKFRRLVESMNDLADKEGMQLLMEMDPAEVILLAKLTQGRKAPVQDNRAEISKQR